MNVEPGRGSPWLPNLAMTIAGVLIGGLITHFAAVRLKRWDRMVDYEIQSRKQVYGPLYREVQALQRKLDEYPYIWYIDTESRAPSSTESVLGEFRHWSRVSEDERRLRVPADFRATLDGLLSLISTYNDLRERCVSAIDEHVRGVLTELSGKEIRLRNLGEAVADEILAGGMAERSVFAEQCAALGIDDTPVAFTRACGVRQARPVSDAIAAASELRSRLASVSDDLQSRVERILARYERGGSKV